MISGKGEGVVLASGRNTLYGKSYMEGIRSSDGFEKGANSIARVMLKFMFVLVPIVFVCFWNYKRKLAGSFFCLRCRWQSG